MNRFRRLLYGFILPPVLGSFVATLALLFSSVPTEVIDIISGFVGWVFVIPFALVIVGFQSVIFSLVMEFIILARISNMNYVIAIGCLLGVLSSFFMGILFCVIGALVGGLSSYCLFRRYNLVHRESS